MRRELEEREQRASQLTREKQNLSETSEELLQRLRDIEKQAEAIQNEKKQAQEK